MSAAPKHRGLIVLASKLKVARQDMKALRDAGYVVVRGTSADVKVVLPSLESFDGNEITAAAFRALKQQTYGSDTFGKILLDSIIANLEVELAE